MLKAHLLTVLAVVGLIGGLGLLVVYPQVVFIFVPIGLVALFLAVYSAILDFVKEILGIKS